MSHVDHTPIRESGLYRSSFEHENCGFGLIANLQDNPSHWLVERAIEALGRLTHRGAVAADGKSGDGCGLLIKKPDTFFRQIAAFDQIQLKDLYAVGSIFLNRDKNLARNAESILENELNDAGLEIAGWRTVPIDPAACGEEALQTLPIIKQIFINAPESLDETDFERALFVARRKTEIAIEPKDAMFYVASLSSNVISYKGLVMPEYLATFYKDLGSKDLQTSICVFHQRFSTNTWPQWKLAQPFRFLAHNGEINTVQGNRNWARARAHTFKTDGLPDLAELQPLVSMHGSDSCSLDNMLEILVAGGMDIFRAMRLLIPPAWQNIYHMEPELRAFYEFSSMHMEPWDGPAGIVLTDGRFAACTMDRNGLRPARYVITDDGHITLASEIGVYDYAPESVVSKGRLSPGQMLAVDTQTGEILHSDAIDQRLQKRHPYMQWLHDHSRKIESTLDNEPLSEQPFTDPVLQQYEKMFDVTFEERDQVLRVLAEAGQEAVGSMGDDTPLPVLSKHVRSVYDSFRQQFAQVTNPPIDPLRESIVMSLETCLGRELNMFQESPEHAARLMIDSPVLSENKFRQLLTIDDSAFNHHIIDLNVDLSIGLEESIQEFCTQAEDAANNGSVLIVLSDRSLNEQKIPVHAALACGAVHHHLINQGLRCKVNIVVESGTVRDAHHFAVLIGYGATAIYPYLAYESLQSLLESGEIKDRTSPELARAYRQGINKGLKKIMSKMGISTIASYRGAQLFEIIGFDNRVVDLCFTGTTNRIGGANFDDLYADQCELAKRCWNVRIQPRQGGLLKYIHGGEYHAYNPDVVQLLQTAVKSGDYSDYKKFSDLVNHRPVTALRDLLAVSANQPSIPIDEVEPIEAITLRFDSAGMSLGALSPQAHETLAQAMNRMGGRSNSGEGGEDPIRYGTDKTSKIKQVASGRFGVTPHYLVNAEVIQIKIAQGAKPGEGGQLPGHKVNKMIATLRYSNPGVSLISPPPHHDIYSIEDLAQLIFDLKQVNPEALVSVKLVAEAGVGTIAAGVAKAYADLITISGYDGGTGASPMTSIKYAGGPWELGLTETHATLRANNLRSKVRLQADGGLKTGLDVIKAAILGAESFGFGTAPMIAMGCKYLRICHLNNCATGVATQDNVLRLKHFIGEVEMVMNYFRFVAQETREWMSKLGVRNLTDLIGRTDLLQVLPGSTGRQQQLQLQTLLNDSGIAADKPQFCTHPKNAPFDKGELAEQIISDTSDAVLSKSGGEFSYAVKNTDRSIGARLSGFIAKQYGNYGMSDQPITLNLTGTAGQSFGVWNAGGLNLRLCGDANDYVGKGMAAGKIVLYPPKNSQFDSQFTTIMGNTCLYGATGGKLFAAGLAGERFAVRNSGATAVVEGIGDHGCEYMTGGVVVVLGSTGVNFGAGMTGGFSFVLDQDNSFTDRFNRELVEAFRISPEEMEAHRNYLRSLLNEFVEETSSQWGQHILDTFESIVHDFWLVKPKATELNTLLDNLKRAA